MHIGEKIHIWNYCHNCRVSPIVGIRYQCQSCPSGPDNDLCENCFALYRSGVARHPLEHVSPRGIAGHEFLRKEGADPACFTEWLTIESSHGRHPKVRNGFVVRPEFYCGYDSYFGGHAFVVKTPRATICLTALHVLDEVLKRNNIDATDSNVEYRAEEIASIIDKVHLYDVIQERWMFHDIGTCRPMLVLPDARLGDEEPISHRDICAFLVDSTEKLVPGRLAKNPPDVGDVVWLAARTADGSHVRKAVIVHRSEESLVYRYDSNAPLARYSSGAPVLNEAGEVVGINVGCGSYRDGLFGHANHVGNIEKHLSRAYCVPNESAVERFTTGT